MHHESKAFRKERPGMYTVTFESGMQEQIQANSQRDAMLKTNHLQGSYGPFKKALINGSERKQKGVKSYAKSQADLFKNQ